MISSFYFLQAIIHQLLLPGFVDTSCGFVDRQIRASLHANSICHITTRSLTGPNNLDHLPSFHSIISSHWIVRLNAWELGIAKAVPLEKFLFLILGKN